MARLLCSPPTFLSSTHLLNPWMRWDDELDVTRSMAQWERLVETLRDAGAEVEVLPASLSAPAMTFTRDVAVPLGDRLLTLTNLGPRGKDEPRRVRRWLRRHAVASEAWPDDELLEGGNVVPTGWGWLLGVRTAADAEPTRRLSRRLREITGGDAAVVPLDDPRFGHLDMVLADLGPLWLAYPPALRTAGFGSEAWAVILGDRPVVELEESEALRLSANVVRIGDTVVGDLSPRLCRVIEAAGLQAAPVVLDEPRRAGGGAHCLTLELPDPVPLTSRTTATTMTHS